MTALLCGLPPRGLKIVLRLSKKTGARRTQAPISDVELVGLWRLGADLVEKGAFKLYK